MTREDDKSDLNTLYVEAQPSPEQHLYHHMEPVMLDIASLPASGGSYYRRLEARAALKARVELRARW